MLSLSSFNHQYANQVMFHRDHNNLTPDNPNPYYHNDIPYPRPDTAGSAASSAWDPDSSSLSPSFNFRAPSSYDDKHTVHPPDHPRPSSSGYPRHSPARPDDPQPPAASPDAAQDDDSASKTYSFVALPGNAVKKRPRRRYDEIERLYHCSWPGCTKSYGTLNHLNAHIVMQRHGGKRSPGEFKELRKQWRKAKKDEAERASSSAHHMSLANHSVNALLQQPGDDYGLHHSQARLHPLGLHHAHSDPRLGHHPYPPQRHHLQQQQATPLHSYAGQGQGQPQAPMGAATPALGIPLNLAGPGMERYASSLPVDDIGMRYGPQAHHAQMYDALPARERHSSLYTIPPSMQQQQQQSHQHQHQHPHGLVALDTGAGAWSGEHAGAAYDAPASAGASTSARQPWLGDYDRRAQQPHHRLSLPAALPSSRYAAPLHQYAQHHEPPPQPQPRVQQHNPLPPDSTLLTPLPGYEPPQPPPGLEYEAEEEGEGGEAAQAQVQGEGRYW